MTELPLFSNEEDKIPKIPPSPEMLKKIAVAAATAAGRSNNLQVVRKGFADRYVWLERTGDTDEVFGMRSGKFKPEPMAAPLDTMTQLESFVGMTGEYRFRLRDLRYERSRELQLPWVGQLQTFAFDWSEDGGVSRSELDIKSVPSMTTDEAHKLRTFYGEYFAEDIGDIAAEETLVVTEHIKLPLYAGHCARLLASFRRDSRQENSSQVA